MSLIGPRPLLIEYLPKYNEFQRHRHEQLGDFIYNVYKSRFLKLNTGMIDWKNEKKEQLMIIKFIFEKASLIVVVC